MQKNKQFQGRGNRENGWQDIFVQKIILFKKDYPLKLM